MSSAMGGRMPLADAERLACKVVDLLRPVAERIEMVGSIRRRKADVGDIEILAAPLVASVPSGMFGDLVPSNLLDERLRDLTQRGVLACRLDKDGRRRMGTRYMALVYRGFPVDLFCCLPPAEFGVLKVIRTGPADYSRLLVTDRRHGGMMPEWAVVRDGAIRHRATGEVIPTPEEADVYRVLGTEPLSPEAR